MDMIYQQRFFGFFFFTNATEAVYTAWAVFAEELV